MNDLAVCFALNPVEFFAHGIARGGHAVGVDQTRLAQFLHHHRHAAGFVEVFGDIGAARLHVDKVRRVAEDFADVFEEKVDTRLVRHRRKVQTGIGGPTGAGHDAGGVLERLTGTDVAGADVLFDQVHHGGPGGHAVFIT